MHPGLEPKANNCVTKGDSMSPAGANQSMIIDINGSEIHVEQQGEGTPIVLVQGGLHSSKVYEKLVPLLAERFHVVTFDTRGHGQSTNPSGELTYRLIADDTAALIGLLGLDRPFVGGWSDGGQVAIELGMHYPKIARGLIVGGTMTDFQSEKVQAGFRNLFHLDQNGNVDSDAFERDAPEFANWMKSAHLASANQWKDVFQQTATMWMEYPDLTRELVEFIATPALLVYGDRDHGVPFTNGLQLYDWLPNAELAILPGCDHMHPLLEPATFAAVITEFVERHAASETS